VSDALPSRPTTLTDYLAIFRRRLWIVLLPLVLVPVLSLVLSAGQKPLYQASATIFVKRGDIGASSAGVFDPSTVGDPNRLLKTKASLVRAPTLADRVVAGAGVPGMTAGAFLGSSSVTPNPDADLLEVVVTNLNAHDAVLLVNTYAQKMTEYLTEIDTARINDALDNVKTRIAGLRAQGISFSSAAYAQLLQDQTQLETFGKLLANNTQVLRPAKGAAQIRPRTRRNAILGLLLGGFLGVGLMFLAEALDKRVRSEREVEQALGLPLLGRIPKPDRRLTKASSIVMLAEPRSVAAEPIRKLRTNIEFMNLERNVRTIMVTSSVQREGKSTTIANLGVALARAGRRVVLVDLDLRRPYLNRFMMLPAAPGITDVVLGRLELTAALRAVPIPAAESRGGRRGDMRAAVDLATNSTNGHRRVDGVLNVLPAGTLPPDAGEFVGMESVGKILAALGKQFDYVLIDAPPLLAVGDAQALSAAADAMFVIVRLNVVHRGMLKELARLLESCPAEKLGYVLAGAEFGEGYGYQYAYEYEQPEPERSRRQPVS
jgi:Mrp family chromosome partitioning ATPase/capsular polysaccharide biosynthesis protein